MAMKETREGGTITLKNGTGGNAAPYRAYAQSVTDPTKFVAVANTGDRPIGVLKKDMKYENGYTGDGEYGTLITDGIADIDCGGTISAGDLVKIEATTGRVLSIGGANSLSSLSPNMTGVTAYGIALESGTSGGRISVLISPQLIFAA